MPVPICYHLSHEKTNRRPAACRARFRTHETTNTVISLRTDESGNYAAVNLIPGSYTVTAEHAGFSRRAYRETYELVLAFYTKIGRASCRERVYVLV